MHFVIIGGDAAGMSAASKAKRIMPELDITVLEKSMDVSYSACGMPYNIADPQRKMDELIVRKAEVFRKKQGINLLTGHYARRLDVNRKRVSGTLSGGKEFEFPYDKLMIATGASPIMPDIPGMDLPGVMALKTLEDGRKIKRLINKSRVRKVLIIGMGYIALEMCEALRELNLRVDMVKPNPVFLPKMDKNLSKVVRDEVENKGVRLYAGKNVNKIEQSETGLKVFCDDITLDTHMVLVAVGVTPNSKIAADAGIKTGIYDSISVNSMMQTSDDSIYSAGDCADALHIVSGEKIWIPLALWANRGGWAVADNVCGKETRLQGIVGTSVFKVFKQQVARTGLDNREAANAGFDFAQATIRTNSRAHAHPGSSDIWVHMIGDKKTGRLLGAQMVGMEGVAHRINSVAVALHNKSTVEHFSHSDMAYAPPFGPVWDPLLTAANQLVKKL